jgi:hypothetical protein
MKKVNGDQEGGMLGMKPAPDESYDEITVLVRACLVRTCLAA